MARLPRRLIWAARCERGAYKEPLDDMSSKLRFKPCPKSL